MIPQDEKKAAVKGSQGHPRPLGAPDKYQPVVIAVGRIPKKKCPPGQILVMEIEICMDIDS